jgi:hypothetical protein
VKKVQQNTNNLLNSLSKLETEWKDDFAIEVIDFLELINVEELNKSDKFLAELLDANFKVASTVFRLFLEKSKDEYTSTLKELISEKGMIGKKGFEINKDAYISKLKHLVLREKIIETINKKYTWKDIIIERLKSGRGSAIKGQKRGRQLEDFVENIVKEIFSNYDVRCSFVGMTGNTTEKTDFAIPSKSDPEIIIEVKGYGATGSKQTDVIGDVNRIIQEKRHDTTFILFTDGTTWKERESDFKKLVDFQNQGYIYKIYTKEMRDEFVRDLILLSNEKNI